MPITTPVAGTKLEATPSTGVLLWTTESELAVAGAYMYATFAEL
jgi:hypothetical protein